MYTWGILEELFRAVVLHRSDYLTQDLESDQRKTN
jgi:hypothetical protein